MAEGAPSVSVCKCFLGGISWDTTEEHLSAYFAKYGEVQEVIVMKDRLTRQPRGFGFITFKEPSAAQLACAETHVIDGRTIDAKPSVPQGQGADGSTKPPRSKKIFVGGLASETVEEGFRAYFERFGKVADAAILVDHTSNRSRGFGFITYEDDESVARVFNSGPMHELDGKQVEIKSATPKGSGPMPPSGAAAGGGGRAGAYGGGAAFAYGGGFPQQHLQQQQRGGYGGGVGGGMPGTSAMRTGGGGYGGGYGGGAMGGGQGYGGRGGFEYGQGGAAGYGMQYGYGPYGPYPGMMMGYPGAGGGGYGGGAGGGGYGGGYGAGPAPSGGGGGYGGGPAGGGGGGYGGGGYGGGGAHYGGAPGAMVGGPGGYGHPMAAGPAGMAPQQQQQQGLMPGVGIDKRYHPYQG